MNRAELARAAAACDALAKQFKARLAEQATDEFHTQGIVPSWKLPGITVYGSTSNPSVEITDEAAFLAWVTEHYPTEVETIRRPRPAWCREFLAQVAERGDPPCMPEGEVIPGLTWRPGGEWGGISMRVDSTVKALLAKQAEEIATGARPLELPAVVAP